MFVCWSIRSLVRVKMGCCKELVPARFPMRELTANAVLAPAGSWVQLLGMFVIFRKVSGLLQEGV